MKNFLKKLINLEQLSFEESVRLMDDILSQKISEEKIAFILGIYECRYPSAQELVGFVTSILNHSNYLSSDYLNQKKQIKNNIGAIIDVCGTGGDGLGTFNISTCVAFVVASLGVKVAKHGNRAISGKCGSFDVLEFLQIPFCHTLEQAHEALVEEGLAFLFAPSFYPVLAPLSPLRQKLGVRTLLNALGPLLNPLAINKQLIGVYSKKLLAPMADALRILGREESMIVHADDGGDEIGVCVQTHIAHFKGNKELEFYNIPPFYENSKEILFPSGGNVGQNAKILLSVLQGGPGISREIIAINAGAALMIAGQVSTIKEGIKRAKKAIDSGKPLELLKKMQKKEYKGHKKKENT